MATQVVAFLTIIIKKSNVKLCLNFIVLYCALLGEDYQILQNETPESKRKINFLASLIFIPTFIWLLIGFLLAHNTLHLSTATSILVALFSATLILLVERAIISVEGNKRIYVFRVVLGFLIAIIGATVLDEQLFKEDIETQLIENQVEAQTKLQTDIDAEFLDKETAQNQVITSKFEEWQNAEKIALSEADGSSGSGNRGWGPISKQKKAVANSLKTDYEKAKIKLASLQTQKQEILKKREEVLTKSYQYSGFLTNIKALFQLVSNDWCVLAIYSCFFGFFLLIEFIVIILKDSIKPTNYERRKTMIENIGKKRMNLIQKRDKKTFKPQMLTNEYKMAVKAADTIESELYWDDIVN